MGTVSLFLPAEHRVGATLGSMKHFKRQKVFPRIDHPLTNDEEQEDKVLIGEKGVVGEDI